MFVLFVDVDCVVDELLKVCIQVDALVFFILCCVVDVLYVVVVLFVV